MFGSAAKAALAGLLSFLLVVSATLSVSHSFHQKVHTGNASAGHPCLICSLSKGQVSAADVAPVLAIFVFSLLFCIPLYRSARLAVTDRRLAPTRGPPSNLSSCRVVG
jgi:hypothetical protein